MAAEIKYNTAHPAGATPEERIRNRLRNSGEGAHADVVTQQGEGPTRVFHNVHPSAAHVPLPFRKEEPEQ
jgi:hypothetical protein